jgi:predicted DNA binding CopG/RHH family protein
MSNKKKRQELIMQVIELDQEVEMLQHQDIPDLLKQIQELKPTKKELEEIQDLIDMYIFNGNN